MKVRIEREFCAFRAVCLRSCPEFLETGLLEGTHETTRLHRRNVRSDQRNAPTRRRNARTKIPLTAGSIPKR
jgi:hypothetical protein